MYQEVPVERADRVTTVLGGQVARCIHELLELGIQELVENEVVPPKPETCMMRRMRRL